MPNDPTLYPSIPSAQQQLVQRQGSLEARVAALESKRDPVFTPMTSLQALNSFTLPWYGGRMWALLGANGQASGAATVTNTLKINGAVIPGGLGVIQVTDAGGDWSTDRIQGFQVPAASLSLGDNTLTMTTSGGLFGSFTGIFIEWPQS
jgi:hypothetical protein